MPLQRYLFNLENTFIVKFFPFHICFKYVLFLIFDSFCYNCDIHKTKQPCALYLCSYLSTGGQYFGNILSPIDFFLMLHSVERCHLAANNWFSPPNFVLIDIVIFEELQKLGSDTYGGTGQF